MMRTLENRGQHAYTLRGHQVQKRGGVHEACAEDTSDGSPGPGRQLQLPDVVHGCGQHHGVSDDVQNACRQPAGVLVAARIRDRDIPVAPEGLTLEEKVERGADPVRANDAQQAVRQVAEATLGEDAHVEEQEGEFGGGRGEDPG